MAASMPTRRRSPIARRKPVKPRHKPLASDTVIAILARFGSWFITPERIADACDASVGQVRARLRALLRARVVESAQCATFGAKRPSFTWRLKRP